MKNAAQQYIDLFHQNRALIDSHSAPVLNSRREEAMRDFEQLGLPGKSQEAFLHTDVEAFYAPDYGLNLARITPKVDFKETFRCAVPDLESRPFFFAGDIFLGGGDPGTAPRGSGLQPARGRHEPPRTGRALLRPTRPH